jgi:pyruvyltransferase
VTNNFQKKARAALSYLGKDIFILNNPKNPVIRNQVNLNWWSMKRMDGTENLGDWLSKVICDYMLEMRNISPDKKVNGTKHLYAVGSVLGFGYKDGTVWGSGIIKENLPENNLKRLRSIKLDIRCVRGPESRRVLQKEGFICPEVYGDPAVLLPLFYKPEGITKKRKYSLILHYSSGNREKVDPSISIAILTKDYKTFVDRMLESELIIASSLHGVILAEAYGVPAILLNDYDKFDVFKYRDYYLSTNRDSFNVAASIEEALKMTPAELPDLTNMQEGLIASFPYDLWEK